MCVFNTRSISVHKFHRCRHILGLLSINAFPLSWFVYLFLFSFNMHISWFAITRVQLFIFTFIWQIIITWKLNYVSEFAEIMDFGYPQNLSPEILKLYITQEGIRSPFSSKVTEYLFLEKSLGTLILKVIALYCKLKMNLHLELISKSFICIEN